MIRYHVGIDVGKSKHHACVLDTMEDRYTKVFPFTVDRQDFERFLIFLRSQGPVAEVLVGVEASGPYALTIGHFLLEHGYTVIELNPFQASQFRKAQGKKAKTDRVDARSLAAFLAVSSYKPLTLGDPLWENLRELTRFRVDLVKDRTCQVNRLQETLAIAYFFCKQLGSYLNINLENFGMTARVLYLEIGAALVIPIIAALVPVTSGVRVSIRETLSNYGIAKSGNGFFDRLLVRVRGLPRPVLLSLRNTFRRKGRLAMTLGTLTLAGTLFISVMNVKDALILGEADLMKEFFAFDVQLAFEGNYRARSIEERALRINGVAAAEARTDTSMQVIKNDNSKGQSFNVIGLPVDSIFTRPQMNSGRWLADGDENNMVISSALKDKLPDVAVGDTVTLWVNNKKRDWKIIGVFPDPYDLLAYAEFGYLSRSLGRAGLASQVFIAKDPGADISQDELAARIEKSFKDSGIKVVATMTKDTIASSWSGRDAFTVNFLMSMAAMAAVIGGLGLMGLMSLNVLERTREIGVMRSIGAASSSVGSIVMTEGLIIGALAWLFAIPASIPISLAFNTAMGNLMVGNPLAFVFSPSGLYLWGGTVAVIAIAASLLPAYRAMKMSIRETLAYE